MFTIGPLKPHLSAGEAAGAPSVSYFPSRSFFFFIPPRTLLSLLSPELKSSTNPECSDKNENKSTVHFKRHVRSGLGSSSWRPTRAFTAEQRNNFPRRESTSKAVHPSVLPSSTLRLQVTSLSPSPSDRCNMEEEKKSRKSKVLLYDTLLLYYI